MAVVRVHFVILFPGGALVIVWASLNELRSLLIRAELLDCMHIDILIDVDIPIDVLILVKVLLKVLVEVEVVALVLVKVLIAGTVDIIYDIAWVGRMANVEFTTTASEAESTVLAFRSTRGVGWAAAEPARDTGCGLIAGLDVGGASLTTSGSGSAGKRKSHKDESEIEGHFD